MATRQPYNLDRTVRLLITVTVIIASVFLIHLLKDVLLPFCVSWLIAYMAEPFVQLNRRLFRLKGRVLATFITLLQGVLILVLLFYFLGPIVSRELNNMGVILRHYADNELKGKMLPDIIHDFVHQNFNFREMSETLTHQQWIDMLRNTVATSWNILSGGLTILLKIGNWLFAILYLVFIMIDYDKLVRGFKAMIPTRHRSMILTIGHDIKISMNHYFRGQALIALIVGILFSIGFLIIGMPMAIVFGLFIGILNLVPYLQLISLIPAAALCLVYSVGEGTPFWDIATKCIIVYVVVQIIQDLYLTPRIMGKAMGLNPAIILLSLSVWGTLFGFIGLIIALPLTTMLLSYYELYITGNTNAPWRKRSERDIEEITRWPN